MESAGPTKVEAPNTPSCSATKFLNSALMCQIGDRAARGDGGLDQLCAEDEDRPLPADGVARNRWFLEENMGQSSHFRTFGNRIYGHCFRKASWQTLCSALQWLRSLFQVCLRKTEKQSCLYRQTTAAATTEQKHI